MLVELAPSLIQRWSSLMSPMSTLISLTYALIVDDEDLPYNAQDSPEDGDHMFMATIPSEEAFI